MNQYRVIFRNGAWQVEVLYSGNQYWQTFSTAATLEEAIRTVGAVSGLTVTVPLEVVV